ncbi:MAG: gamma-glutamyl-gamma-aminobutyrate hydrolase family protein [Acidimicrobiales bacterium]
MKPLIGITGREFPYGRVEGAPPVLWDAMVDAVLTDYVDAVLASGGVPVHVPLRVDPAELIDRLDGLLLTGGTDVDPARYGAEPTTELLDLEPERDEFELRLAAMAVERSKPTLGICRGIQLLNVAAGGTLVQHVPSHARFDATMEDTVHDVKIEPDSALGAAYGERVAVNSFHHQVLDEVGQGIRVIARADDGEIEGIEFDGKPIVAVQWHPEMFHRREPIFDWLVSTSNQ